MERIRATPDDGRVLVFDVALRDGRALVAVNAAQEAVSAEIPTRVGFPAVRAGLAAGRTLYLRLDAAGRVVAAAAQSGLAVGGAEVLGAGDCAFVALDGRDLRESEQVMALPFGAGRFACQRAPGAAALAGEVGEFRAGKWTVLEPQKITANGAALTCEADATTAYDVRLLSTPSRAALARENAERLLRMRPLKNE